MAKLKEKSNFNMLSAELLAKETYHASSVHCAYYSCFQLLKYTIKEYFEESYSEQDNQRASNGQGTHQFVINYVYNEIVSIAGIHEGRQIKRKIDDLKQFRIESDYHDIEVDSGKSDKAINKAKEIRDYLATNFRV